ncbi:MAG: adenosylmethionine--8-amino-7-oxononanoate transaminase [Gemmataceae bacterium]
MSSFLVLGTDTDVGKTAFSALWLAAFAEHYAYWKPIETGPSDSGRIRALVPAAQVFPALCSLAEPVAPPLAARRAGVSLPRIEEIAARLPRPAEHRHLLVETFGGPWSPLDESTLQLELIRRLEMPRVLVSSTRLGAVGRTLQCLKALEAAGAPARAVALFGPDDDYARTEIARHADAAVVALQPPREWTSEGVATAAREQIDELRRLFALLEQTAAAPPAGALLPRDRAAVWHPYTPLAKPPSLVCAGADREFLILDDGRRLIDAISSWWTIQNGHRDPALMRALRDATRHVDHVLFAGVTHPWGVELAEILLRSCGFSGGRVFYSDNGSTAVEVALKMAYQYWRLTGRPERVRFVGFEHGYHGDTFGAMAVSRDPVFFGHFEPLLFSADILPLDPGALEAHLRRHAHETAAVILEPLVQGAGGMRMHAPQTLTDLCAVARRHNVLFIADEVLTGGGRTGSVWAFQQAGIEPDLICAAKTLAGGIMPLAATLVHPRVVEPFKDAPPRDTFFHGHSFTGHPLACAVALANWRQASSWTASALRIEAFWRGALARFVGGAGTRAVRIRGAIAALELNSPGGYLSEMKQRITDIAERKGVFLRPLGSVVYALPPYCISEESLQGIVDAFDAIVGDMSH